MSKIKNMHMTIMNFRKLFVKMKYYNIQKKMDEAKIKLLVME